MLRAEIGRVIFGSYYRIKTLLVETLNSVRNGRTQSDNFWRSLNRTIQQTFGYKVQEHHRIQTIIAFILDRVSEVPQSETTNIIERLDLIPFIIENELVQFYNEMTMWDFVNDFNCPLSNWEFVSSSNGYDLVLDSCSESTCPNREDILRNFFRSNKAVIARFIAESQTICNQSGYQIDEKLLDTLQILSRICHSSTERFDFRRRYCWSIADFLICMLRDDGIYFLTINVPHFYVILTIFGYDANIIHFDASL